MDLGGLPVLTQYLPNTAKSGLSRPLARATPHTRAKGGRHRNATQRKEKVVLTARLTVADRLISTACAGHRGEAERRTDDCTLG